MKVGRVPLDISELVDHSPGPKLRSPGRGDALSRCEYENGV